MAEHAAVQIREARPDEFDRIGELRVAAYRADGFLSEASAYAQTLRVLGMDAPARSWPRWTASISSAR